MNILDRWYKKRHYKNKYLTNKKKAWDLEFLREQMREEREVYRQEYDRLSETMSGLEVRMQKLNDLNETIGEGMDREEEIKKAKEAMQTTLDRRAGLIRFMDTIDKQIEGVDEPGDDGVTIVHKKGLTETIDDYQSLNGLLKNYMDRS